MPRHVHFREDKRDEQESNKLHPLLQYDMAIVLWLVQQKEKRPWLRTLVHSTTSRRRTQDISLLLWFVFITMIPELGFPYFWICVGNLLAVVIFQHGARMARPLDLHPFLWEFQPRRNIDDLGGFPCVDCHMAVVVLLPAILHSQSVIVQFLFVLIGFVIALGKLLLATRFVSQVLVSFVLGFTGILIGNHGNIIVKSYKLPQGYTIASILALLVLLMITLGMWIENNESSVLSIPKQDFLDVFTTILHSDAPPSTAPSHLDQLPQTSSFNTRPTHHKLNEDEQVAGKRDSFYFLVQGMRATNNPSSRS